MFYIKTADHLQRTARWLENLEGGIQYLREVVIEDKLGIAEELERQMSFLVNTYKCEWTETVKDPEKKQLFRQFVNQEAIETTRKAAEEKVNKNPQHLGIEFIQERGQRRPADWPKLQISYPATKKVEFKKCEWVLVTNAEDVPMNGGSTILYGNVQIAVFNFTTRNSWYATQNLCTHRNSLLLSQGLIGEKNGIPTIASPLHKKLFNLETGESMDGSLDGLMTFPIKVEDGKVFLFLPTKSELNKVMASEDYIVKAAYSIEEKESGCTTCTDDKLVW